MQFMQRSLEKKEQEKLERERKRLISEAEWVLDYEQLDVEKPLVGSYNFCSFLNKHT